MSISMQLKAISPEGVVLDKEVSFVKFNAIGGEVGVLPNHSPMLAKISSGECIVKDKENKNIDYYFIPSGTAEITEEKIILLVPYLEEGKQIDLNRAKQAKERASERLNSKSEEPIDKKRAENSLARAESRLALHEALVKLRII